MEQQDQMTIVARDRADKRIDTALGELRAAAKEIGEKHGIPDGVAGHSVAELLGRMGWIPAMARELRRACAQELASQELNSVFEQTNPLPEKPKSVAAVVPQKEPAPATVKPVPANLDVSKLEITTNTERALRAAGLNNVGDVVAVPDAHLVKINGLGEKSVAQIRAAIAKASG